jgi:putative ABC transport system substrate-binding protein
LVTVAVVCAAATPVTAAAQGPAAVARVATLGSESTDVWDVFERRLSALGYVEGRNLGLERRWSQGFTERVPTLLAEILRTKPDVVVASMMPPSASLDPAHCVPILAIGVAESYGACRVFPVANLSAAAAARQLSATHLRLARAAVPSAARVTVLTDPSRPFLVEYVEGLRRAAQPLGIAVLALDVSRNSQDALVDAIARQNPDVLIAAPAFGPPHGRRQLLAHVRRMRIASVGSHMMDGVVVAADYDWRDLARRAASFVDQILKGATPGQLDRDAPVKFEIVVDGQAAAAIGLAVPELLLQEADRVLD